MTPGYANFDDEEDDYEEIEEIEPERNPFTAYETAFADGYAAGAEDAMRDTEEATKRKRRAKAASGAKAKTAKAKLSKEQAAIVRNFMAYRR